MLALLSHKVGVQSPMFNAGEGLKLTPIKLIKDGGSSNNYSFSMPCHGGTHVDAPRHFDDSGRPIASFSLEELAFERPTLLDVPKGDGELIVRKDLEPFERAIGRADFLLLRTGWERLREPDPQRFSTRNPGMSEEGSDYIRTFTGLRALGLDSISLSSVPNREEGRSAHRSLLERRDFLIVEDMHLSEYPIGIKRIIVSPIFLEGVDSAPCTVIAEL